MSLIHAKDVQEAAAAVEADLRPDDVVLVKGRDTQRLDRFALALLGTRVVCALDFCNLMTGRCATCPNLSAMPGPA